MNKEFQKASDITPEMIQEWEEKFKTKVNVAEVALTDEDDRETGEKAKFFIRRPDRTLVNTITKYNAEKDYEKGNNVLIKNCVLGGDMQYLAPEEEGGDDDVYFAIIEQIGKLISKKKARLLN